MNELKAVQVAHICWFFVRVDSSAAILLMKVMYYVEMSSDLRLSDEKNSTKDLIYAGMAIQSP